MKKLTMKQVRKMKMKAIVYVLNSWYVNPQLLTSKHASQLAIMVER